MLRRGVIGELDIIDDIINDFRLHRLNLAIALLLDVDTKVILDVYLVLNV